MKPDLALIFGQGDKRLPRKRSIHLEPDLRQEIFQVAVVSVKFRHLHNGLGAAVNLA